MDVQGGQADTPTGGIMRAAIQVGVAVLVMTATIQADTLVLLTGRRVQGQLIGVGDGRIEFEEKVGARWRTLIVAREDIARIEFTDLQPVPPVPVTAPTEPVRTIPRGMRERLVDVQANQRWIDTGVDVRDGQQLYFQASGETRWGGRRRDGAAGERNSPVDQSRPIPDRPGAALIARIGDGQDVFFVGADMGPFRARQGGRLYLGINDGHLEDNSGSLRVKVSY